MARGTQFLDLIVQVRNETGRSNAVAVGVEDVEGLKSHINRVYELLWNEYTWPHLRQEFSKTLNAGQQYYDLPSGLDVENIDKVALIYNGLTYNIDRGITFADYDIWDPAANERSDPVLKWDVKYVASAGVEQIEAWPLPAATQTLKFFGQLAFAPMVDDDDICLLDDTLVVLFTTARILKRQKDPDADDALSAANARLAKLRKRMSTGEAPCRLGVGVDDYRATPTRAIVRISGT
ncbi:hypothetical protein [Methyloceanibacter caenitepidi]|uniref:Uncharacterized protein n=1 Tax=Methyloceanibacter caenitepidi TaxID=1384459 RepID=A0A0A8K276_9HYPH|nr:hypothetical protein [Methyloceanibacter caenitepidi]BAQ16104.1 hypothetical protein GL4_0641 [Methyloceanibacter caenitepidi]